MTAKITLYLHAVQYPGACTACARTTEVGQDYRTMHNGQDHSSVCTKCPHRRLSRIVTATTWPDRREGQKEMGRVSLIGHRLTAGRRGASTGRAPRRCVVHARR